MASKISVTVEDEVLEAARALAPRGNLSALVNDALAERVRRERLRSLLADDVEKLGPSPEDAIAHVDSEWPFSSSMLKS
ncbi:MAG: type II toxin-antitoxin system CcdA family antitoxin [Actinomycetota bacterium]|nr:type II toxin-antitoxin system CcdA family antitoxin [Actinomycetota bacterium]